MRRKFVIAWMLLIALHVKGQTIDIGLSLERDTAELGEPVPVKVSITNSGSEALYVEFSGVKYGREGLRLCAEGSGRALMTGPIHIDRDLSANRFDFVPLLPAYVLTAPILSINDPVPYGLEGLIIGEPGTYAVSVAFSSNGSNAAGTIWPIWRGRAVSGAVPLTVIPAIPAKVAERARALQECASGEDECDALIGYFRIVSDPTAADILLTLLQRAGDVPMPWLLEAIANQRRPKDYQALERFAARSALAKASVDAALRRDERAACRDE